MPLQLVQPNVILLHHNDVERDLAVWRLQPGQIGAELVGVERLGLDRTAARAAARGLGVVIGVRGHPAHPQRGVLQHERQHFRPALQVGVDAFRFDDVSDDSVQVGAGRLRGVFDAVALENLVVGNPHSSARTCSRAAIVRSLLDDYCRKTPVGGGEGSNHAGAAAPDDDDVELLSCHVEHVIELPGPGATGPVTRTRGLRLNDPACHP